MSAEKTTKIKNLNELGAFAEEFLDSLTKLPPSERATVVGLSGDLGSGKTAFVKCIAAALGIADIVTSPTFILEKIYTIPCRTSGIDRFTKLIHIDAYRLDGGIEMNALGWKELLLEENNLFFLEWPEQVADAMPEDMIKLSFEYVDETTRRIIETESQKPIKSIK